MAPIYARSIARPILTHQRTRPGTYSIVARDPGNGELGVAVQSHYFSVGPIVPWAEPGVGAVATQASAEITYGPRGLELMRGGLSAADALARLVAADEGSARRQVAMVDAAGGVAAHTGSACIPCAGHVTGDGVSCQGNIMVSEEVWGAMLRAFSGAAGSLTLRLLAALDAAEAIGGDVRGRQSAAVLVVPGSGEPWDKVVELRVEDHPEPLLELRRLVVLHEAYTVAEQADEAAGAGRRDEALALYAQSVALAPDNHELRLWIGLGLAQIGDLDAGLEHVRAAIAIQPSWRGLLERLPLEEVPSVPTVLEALRRAGE